YTFSVTPSAQGLVSINVAAGVATDAAGNGNTAAATLSRTYDSVQPTLVLSTTAADPTNLSPFTVTATFSKSVSGFTLEDITVTNGAASALSGGPSIYTFSITPSSDGLVTVDVAADVATDSVGNGNTAAVTLSRTYDGTAPGLTLSTAVSDPTNVSPFTVTATFSEDVSGFTLGDITVTNGIAGSLSGGPNIYTFIVTPSSNDLVSIDVAADVATDAAGNGNTAAATLSRTYDSVQPTLVLSTTAADPTNLSPFTVTATFGKDVSGFALGDIIVTNGVASSLSGGPSVYTFDVTPSSDGIVSIDVAADVATDSVGNGNTAAATLSRIYDGTAPILVLSTTIVDPTNLSPISLTATFSEDVTDFELGDITVTNGIASSLSGGPSIYTFDVTPSSDGLVSIDVGADVATDSVGNGN
ncbi:MAG: Ig-like domain-containing protein, partial [Nitrososphaerales archaeon]